jgi:hypothetical protein
LQKKTHQTPFNIEITWWIFLHPSSFFHLLFFFFLFLFLLMLFVFAFEFGYKKKSYEVNLGAKSILVGFFPHSSSSSSSSKSSTYA